MPHRGPAWLPKSKAGRQGNLADSARRTLRRRAVVLGTVAAVVIASPFAAGALYNKVRSTDEVEAARQSRSAVPTEIARVVLASMPDVVIPLQQLTGLNLPDLHVRDLQKLPLPNNIPVPEGADAALSELTKLIPAGAALSELAPLLRKDAVAGAPKLSDPASPVAANELPPDIVGAFGTKVKELTHSSPFSMVAVTARDLANTDIRIRAMGPDGTWSQWFSAENLVSTNRSDPQPGTEPIYVGETNTIQLVVSRKTAAATAPGAAPLGYAPASISSPLPRQGFEAPEPLPPPRDAAPAAIDPLVHEAAGPAPADDLNVALIAPGSDPADGLLNDAAAPVASGGPRIISRAQWGADESIRCQDPDYDDFIGGAAVHHTAGNNDYTQAESAGIVRAIYAYHATTLGWCDVGYNALVDKYGQIFEGRAGGIDRPVQAAHAGGFNENTVGVAMMGDFETEAPSDAALEATGQFLGWRLKSAKLDPKGHTKMYSEGTDFTPYPEGAEVDLPIIFAHRDVGNTTCPGDAAYAQLDRIRDIAANYSGAAMPLSPEVKAAAPRAAQPTIDVPGLVDTLAEATDDNPISRAWEAQGGSDGPLGKSLSGLIEAKGGQQYAKFTNGYIYTVPGGQIVTMVGRILQKFIELGLDSGALGLPLSSEYAVPEGLRADFEKGSLIFNEVTGFVQAIIQTYDDTYADAYNDAAAPVAASENQAKPALKIPTLDEVAPAPEPVAAPAPEPAHPQTNESIVPIG